jgi:MFS family permease
MKKKAFYGNWITAAAAFTFGLAVGLPYYNIPFFYDYFQKSFGWSASQITLGYPLAALPTMLLVPLLVHRFKPRQLILAGTALTFLAFLCWGLMGGNLLIYYGIWIIYAFGYYVSGPIPHQLLISNWYKKNRGFAMGLIYVGNGLLGFAGAPLVKKLAESLNFHNGLIALGAIILIAWPICIFVLRDKPADMGLNPDGADFAPEETKAEPHSYKWLISRPSFWLLTLSTICAIGTIGAVNFLMKLVFQEQMDPSIVDKEQAQVLLNSTWRSASMIILASSTVGRIVIGKLCDIFPKRSVMAVSYLLSASMIPLLLTVRPPETPWLFALLFGFFMGADYMLIPLVAAEQYGVNSLARAMAIILPAQTVGQTWFPYGTAFIREHFFTSYSRPVWILLGLGLLGALSAALIPNRTGEKPEVFAPKSA